MPKQRSLRKTAGVSLWAGGGRVTKKLVLNAFMVNARQLEPVLAGPAPKRVEDTVQEMEAVCERGGGFETTRYYVQTRGGWVGIYSLTVAGCVDGIEVELVHKDTGPGVPWRRWLRVTAPVGTEFRKDKRTPNRDAARIDMEEVPHETDSTPLRMTRKGIRHESAFAEERQRATRMEPPATSADTRRHLEEILAGLGPPRR